MKINVNRFGTANLLVGGPDRMIKDESGDIIKFEEHPYCGPVALNKKGDPLENQPGGKASFWRVHHWWVDQGKKIDAEGFCVWEKPKPTHKKVHMGGRHWMLVAIDESKK